MVPCGSETEMIEVLQRGVLDVPLMDVQPFPERLTGPSSSSPIGIRM